MNVNVANEKLTYRPAEAAKVLGISLPVMYELCKREDFPTIRIGKSIIIPRSGLEEWLAKQSEKEC